MSETQEPLDFEKLVSEDHVNTLERIVQDDIDAGRICAMCHEGITPEQLDDPDAIYKEVSSWVTGPKLQSPVLRGQTGRIAHASCIRNLLDGEAPDQQAVPGLEDI